jgi:ribulose-5-phosphate 4-epimerase/fuculose-1-phosphate aldolase
VTDDRDQAPPPTERLVDEPRAMSAGEWATRRDLAACYRLVAMNGWDDLLANHLTARVPDEPGAFLINPFGLMFDEVTASNLVKIGPDGEPLSPTEYAVNRTGFVIHSAIHEARPDANCVIHLHTRDGVAVAMTETGVLPLNQTAMAIDHDIAFHEYEGVALDLGERDRITSDLGDKHIMLLRNHGTLTLGRTVGEAFLRTYLLEWACSVQVRALATGQPLHDADDQVVAAVRQHLDPSAMASYSNLVWSALLRRVERHEPDCFS